MSRARLAGVALAAGLAVLPGCQSGAPSLAPEQQQAPSASASASSSDSDGFTNPVYDSNFPDPMILPTGDGDYLSVATNGNGANVQTLVSEDLTSWEQGDDALPVLPEWSSPGKVWAPEVAVQSKSRYVMYYTTRAPRADIQCISVAVAKTAEGPYTDKSSKPLVCEEDKGGSIDAHAFTSTDGKRYLYWKNDGNAVGVDTYISVQELDKSGTTLVGKPERLFKQTLPWEGSLVEAPFLWENGGKFHMFYSANSFASADYAVGHAVADSPLGPFTKTEEPILVSNDVAVGPGHCALFEKEDTVWMVYHAWEPGAVNEEVPGRTMWLSEVTFAADGTVTVVPPTEQYPKRP